MYLCIDLKSFYASVECAERGLDPMKTLLVVADEERTEKTICLAVTPALKALGVKNRCRLYEVPKNLSVIVAPPRMHLYMEYSARIYSIYLKYISAEDIHVYSVDEAFLDVSAYGRLYQLTPRELAQVIMKDIYETTGITATCGIGTNLYLTKIALDIIAKKSPDFIGFLDENLYREKLWDHMPLTDFWNVGSGTAKRLRHFGIYTMRQIAFSDEHLLYKLFGIDAELLIDHAWGRESATIQDIKQYVPESRSISTSQILPRGYNRHEGLLLAKEMSDELCLKMVRKGLTARFMTLSVGFAGENGMHFERGTFRFSQKTDSEKTILKSTRELYSRVVQKEEPIRRIGLQLGGLECAGPVQYSLFESQDELDREHAETEAVIRIKDRFGPNAVFRGMNLEHGARTIERNGLIGGHKA